MSVAVERHFFRADLCEVQAEIGVSRKAIVAAVDLGDSQSNPFAGLHIKCLGQRPRIAEKTFKHGGTGADETEQVWNDTKLLLDGIKQRLGCGGDIVAGRNGQT